MLSFSHTSKKEGNTLQTRCQVNRRIIIPYSATPRHSQLVVDGLQVSTKTFLIMNWSRSACYERWRSPFSSVARAPRAAGGGRSTLKGDKGA